jgi:hypothetical protein
VLERVRSPVVLQEFLVELGNLAAPPMRVEEVRGWKARECERKRMYLDFPVTNPKRPSSVLRSVHDSVLSSLVPGIPPVIVCVG